MPTVGDCEVHDTKVSREVIGAVLVVQASNFFPRYVVRVVWDVEEDTISI